MKAPSSGRVVIDLTPEEWGAIRAGLTNLLSMTSAQMVYFHPTPAEKKLAERARINRDFIASILDKTK